MKGSCSGSKLELLVWLCGCLVVHNKTVSPRVPCRPICTIAVCLTTRLPGPPHSCRNSHQKASRRGNRPASEAIGTARRKLHSRSAPPSRFRQDDSWQTRVRQQCELEVVCHFQMQVNQEELTFNFGETRDNFGRSLTLVQTFDEINRPLMIRPIVTQNSQSAEWSKAAKKRSFLSIESLADRIQYIVIVYRTMTLAPRSSPLLRSAFFFFV
ncbi:hypothetical protein F5887DRAFT_655526 [Amanita rubescens]|nr:hypothetical protein F5887DRAFT_655526 [Amanita rubescens]